MGLNSLFSLMLKGGPTSGNRGHGGIKGHRGGSTPKGSSSGDYLTSTKPTQAEKDWVKSLTPEESKSLIAYVSGGSGIINSKLRNKEPLSESEQKKVSLWDSAISKAPKTKKITTLYRGMPPDVPISSGEFISAARREDMAGVYGEKGFKVIRKFTIPPGTPMATPDLLYFEDAGEVILPRGVKVTEI